MSEQNLPAVNDGHVGPADRAQHRTLTIMDAIYSRRAVRSFTDAAVPETAIHALLYAAAQAPTLSQGATALGFSVISDRRTLHALSDWTGRLDNAIEGETALSYVPDENDPGLGFFHGGGTLIILYSLSGEERHLPECWMAAENIMLAARGMGLGTCLIGPAVDTLNCREWKRRLDVPKEARAIAAIVLGTPGGPLPAVNRFPPEVFSWLP